MKYIVQKISSLGRFLFLPFLFIASFVFAMFQGGFLSWFLFYSFLPFAFYSILVIFYPLKSIQVKRVLKQKEYMANNEVQVDVIIQRNNRFPLLFLLIEDRLPTAFLKKNNSQKRFVYLMFQKKLTYTYTIQQAVRGEHQFQAFTVMTGDLLGFYTKKQEIACVNRLLVYPTYKRMLSEQFSALFEQGLRAALFKQQEVTSIVSGVRPYIPGDRLTSIHWKATARKNEIMTKDFEVQNSQDVCILLDQSPSKSFENLIRLAASLTDAALFKGIRVSFTGTHSALSSVTFGKGEGQRRKVLYELAKIQEAEESKHTFSTIHRKNGNAVYVLVTSWLRSEMISSLSTLKEKNAVMIFLLVQDGLLVSEQEKLVMKAKSNGIPCRMLESATWTNVDKEGIYHA